MQNGFMCKKENASGNIHLSKFKRTLSVSEENFDYIKGTLAAVGTYRYRGVFENERILCSTFTSLSVPEMRHQLRLLKM